SGGHFIANKLGGDSTFMRSFPPIRNESGWDNYETARQLRQEAEELSVGIVDESWRNLPDVIKAVEEFHYPAFMDEETFAFNADEDMGIA
ncbi:hypothetical protein ACO0HH_27380, partial [Klebsiella pneumoniae]